MPAPLHVDENGRWINRQLAANLKGCSVDTIRRAEKKYDFTERYDDVTGERLLSVAELVRYGVIDAVNQDVPDSTVARTQAERRNHELSVKVAELTALNDRLTDEIAFLRSAVTGRAA